MARLYLRSRQTPNGIGIALNDLVRVTDLCDTPLLEQNRAFTQPFDHGHVMADDQHRPPASAHFLHFPKTLLLETGVADGQHLVHDQNLRLEVCGDCKRQSHVHPARIPLDRCIDERFHTRERHNLIELSPHFLSSHAQHRRVQIDVFPAAQLGMKPRPHFK
jgi:hypothetical protein